MPNISDRELDKLFQEAGQELRPEYDPKDWDDLAKRLAKEERRAILKRAGGYGLGVLLLISSAAWLSESDVTRQSQQTRTHALSTQPVETGDDSKQETASIADATATLPEKSSGTTTIMPTPGTGTPAEHALPTHTGHRETVSKGTHDNTTPSTNSTSTEEAARNHNTQYKHTGVASNATAQHTIQPVSPVTTTSGSSTTESITTHNGESQQNTLTQQQHRTSSKQRVITPATPAVGSGKTTPAYPGKVVSDKTSGTTTQATASTNQDEKSTGAGQASHLTTSENITDETTTNTFVNQNSTTRSKSPDKKVALEPIASNKSTTADGNTDNTAALQKTQGNINSQPGIAAQATDTLTAVTQHDDVAAKQRPARLTHSGAVSTQSSASDTTGAFAATNGTSEITTGAALNPDNTAASADSTIMLQQDSVAMTAAQANADSTTQQAPEEKKKPYRAKWFLKMPVSPDFSAINYGKTDKTGINIGLLTEFMPAKHWSLSIGAIWSKKIYTWDNPDKTYGGSGGYGGSGYGPTKASFLNGDCRIVDIPFNITYYLRPEARTNFFISAGLSSYIMLTELYTYTVEADQQEYRYDEKYVCKNKNWFSMLNLSIGIQHRISNRFQIQAEPFLKAPVSGVGQGKVNLNTMGAFFTLKLQLNN